ncbi:hypothetical protein [Streptomyces sp. NPDC018059]|uniref:hypothetical protein n=1 Tax=Streptomyces sp. NPDC018059 TaxID=3365041 RepID=UPI00379B6158
MSENPQVDPRQGFGQAPPPMPGQAPPPVPPQAPGAPSAWSQPVPPGGPGGPGGAGPRGGRARGWLIGGAAALAVAVVVGVVVVTSGDDDGEGGSASAKPGVPGAGPEGAAKPKVPSAGKAFTKVPKGCELIKPATVEKIIPGAECKPNFTDDADTSVMITRMPRWEHPGGGGDYQSLDVNLAVGASVEAKYDLKKRSALKDLKGVRKVEGSRPVSGLGEEGVVVNSVDGIDGSLATTEVVVREGNAALEVGITYSLERSSLTRKQAEDTVTTAARDVLASMS